MSYTRESFLARLLEGYKSSYDITVTDPTAYPVPIAARADMYISEAQYVISKKAEAWSTNSREFVYFVTIPKLDDEFCEKAISFVCEEGMSRIDLKNTKNHMCTRICIIFLCDEADERALERVRKCKIYKNFCFSLKGWMEFHAVAVDLGKEAVMSNRYGKDTADFIRTVLDPSKCEKKNSRWKIVKAMLS